LLAAEEVARLIRLYNISGIILIDFINMESKDMETLKDLCIQLFKGDPVPIILHGFTHTGLMEITRKRTKG
ncbi:MAG: ribonuclease E/G, partial [Eubacteriales bacterium]|nr:ribonuclease E/G [Eubacteriales bacterium]